MSAKTQPKNPAPKRVGPPAPTRSDEIPYNEFIARLNPDFKSTGARQRRNDTVYGLKSNQKKISFYSKEYGLSNIEAIEADKIIRDHFLKARLPGKPIRDFMPYKEDLFEYIRSDDGFARWIEAGALTRPAIRSAPKAYAALAHYLKHNTLPGDLSIPTIHELTDQELAADDAVKEARRVAGAATMRKRRADRQP